MNNFRKEQMRLAVLMEITDTPKRNGEIIRGAESRLILDDEYNRLMKTASSLSVAKNCSLFCTTLSVINLQTRQAEGFTLKMQKQLMKGLSLLQRL